VGGAQPRQPGRFGRLVATGAAAVLLAVGSGLLGGVIATRLDDDGTTDTGNGRPVSAAPVIQRDSLASIADAVQPSVVSVATGNSTGSGVVLSADGYVLTNNHVVSGAQGGEVRITFSTGKSAEGKVVGTDPPTDLAVVKVDGVTDLKPARFGDSSAMQVGDTVLALGSPLGLEGSVTAGIVSALNRTIRANGEQQPESPFSPQQQQQGGRSLSGLLQTDAPINPGNSGGALVNLNGEVIGINTAIATSGESSGNIGVGFAIPSSKAKTVAEQLKAGKKVSHPFLGVNVIDAQGGNGALISSVQPGSPAAKLGLQQGDIVTRLGDKEVNDSDDLVSAVQTGKVGDRVELTYVRNGDQKTATVTLGEAS
jgi:putative serine protease PepD